MTRELLDDDGENRAVRCFLMLYGGTNSPTTEQMRYHLAMSGFEDCWPDWTVQDQHLTKGGAQDWLRYLFGLEAARTVPDTHVLPWQPIETAPKDGTEILGVNDDGIREICRWSKHNHVPLYGWVRQVELYGEEVDGFDPLLWMPLPAAPSAMIEAASQGSGDK